MNKAVKIIVEIILLAGIAGLVYANYRSVMKPVKFNKQRDARKEVAVERLKDIRTLQVAYKSVNNKFVSTVDSLVDFYNKGEMKVTMQVGSKDDTTLDEPTKKATELIRKKNPKIKTDELNAELEKLYNAGNKLIRFQKTTKIPVKEALVGQLTEGFNPDSLVYIPFSGKEKIEMESETRMVSGVEVPLFEARVPWKKLLKGMDNQLRINLDAECRDMNRYEGLQVGSITAPNNNAGNWE